MREIETAGLKLLPFTLADLTSIRSLQPSDWADITPRILHYLNTQHCFPVKAELHGKLAGIGACICFPGSAWLGHIIVHPQLRGRGLGAAITQQLIDTAKQHGAETIQLVATALGYPVYKKLGFADVVNYIYYKNCQPYQQVLHSRIQPMKPSHRKQVLQLDRATCSEDRSNELIPAMQHAFVFASDKEQIDGFYMPTLGDGLILAKTQTAGTALLQKHLQFRTEVIIPATNKVAQQLVLAHGGVEERRPTRMIMGKPLRVKFEYIYNRIGGNKG